VYVGVVVVVGKEGARCGCVMADDSGGEEGCVANGVGVFLGCVAGRRPSLTCLSLLLTFSHLSLANARGILDSSLPLILSRYDYKWEMLCCFWRSMSLPGGGSRVKYLLYYQSEWEKADIRDVCWVLSNRV